MRVSNINSLPERVIEKVLNYVDKHALETLRDLSAPPLSDLASQKYMKAHKSFYVRENKWGIYGEVERFRLSGNWDWITKEEFIEFKERYPGAFISVRLQDVTLEYLVKSHPHVLLNCDKVEIFFASEFVDLERFKLICSLPYNLWFYFDDWKHREPIDYNLSTLPPNLGGLSSYEDFLDDVKALKNVKFLSVVNIQSLSGPFPININTLYLGKLGEILANSMTNLPDTLEYLLFGVVDNVKVDIGHLSKLKSLEIASTNLGTSFLSWKLPNNVETLNLRSCSFEDLSPIENLIKLKTFRASNSYNRFGYASVYSHLLLPDSLTELEIEEFPTTRDLYLPPNLRVLTLPNFDIFDLKVLKIPSSVTNIMLRITPTMESEDPEIDSPIDFSDLKNLSSLDLIQSRLISCSSLSSAKFLNSIHLFLCPFLEDLKGIEELTNLSSLYVICCGNERSSNVPLHRTFFYNTKFPGNLRELVFAPNSSAMSSASDDVHKHAQDYILVDGEPHLKVGKAFRLPESLKYVELEGPQILLDTDLVFPSTLQRLTVNNVGGVYNLPQIAQLECLKTLHLTEANIETLDNLNFCSRLKDLNLSGNDIQSISNTNLGQLKHLTICPQSLQESIF